MGCGRGVQAAGGLLSTGLDTHLLYSCSVQHGSYQIYQQLQILALPADFKEAYSTQIKQLVSQNRTVV